MEKQRVVDSIHGLGSEQNRSNNHNQDVSLTPSMIQNSKDNNKQQPSSEQPFNNHSENNVDAPSEYDAGKSMMRSQQQILDNSSIQQSLEGGGPSGKLDIKEYYPPSESSLFSPEAMPSPEQQRDQNSLNPMLLRFEVFSHESGTFQQYYEEIQLNHRQRLLGYGGKTPNAYTVQHTVSLQCETVSLPDGLRVQQQHQQRGLPANVQQLVVRQLSFEDSSRQQQMVIIEASCQDSPIQQQKRDNSQKAYPVNSNQLTYELKQFQDKQKMIKYLNNSSLPAESTLELFYLLQQDYEYLKME